MRGLWACALFVCLYVPPHVRAQSEDDSEAVAPEPSPPPAEERASTLPVARIAAGVGLTQRSIKMPTNEGLRGLETGFVPALALRLNARWYSDRTFIGVHIGYQTSLGVSAVETVHDAATAASENSIRTHRFEGGLAPGMRFGAGRDSSSLTALLGYAIRAFGSVETLRIPRYSLHGPLLRLSFDLPLFEGRVELRLAPEVHAIIAASEQLRAAAGIGHISLAYGGEASLRVQISGPWGARLCYRESHLASRGIEGRSFEDIERYLWLELNFRYE